MEVFEILSSCGNVNDKREQIHLLAKLLGKTDSNGSVTLPIHICPLTNQLSYHIQAIDDSNLPNLLPEGSDILMPEQQLAQSVDMMFTQWLGDNNYCLPMSLHADKKVDFSKLFAEASPPPIETNFYQPCAPKQNAVHTPSDYNNPAAVCSGQSAGVKRLGGFRAPVALPPPPGTEPSKTGENVDDDDDEYEPDPKIRAKKQWRKQYDAAKAREAERKYNTPKFRDDGDSRENTAQRNFTAPNPEFQQPQPPMQRQPQGPHAALNSQPTSQNFNRPPAAGAKPPGFRPASKFVSPLLSKKNEGEQQQSARQAPNFDGAVKENFIRTALNAESGAPVIQDERLKTLDPGMIELILSEIVDHGSKVEWSDVAGLEIVKKNIMEVIVWPMLRPDLFTGIRGPPKGLLLFGPPGTGKTMIGKCIASQCNATFFSISASSLLSKWFGEAEKMVRTLFAVARTKQPAVIFIDEVDSMLCKRGQDDQECSRRIKTEFLVQLDGVCCGEDDRILMIGATNLPSELDEAARRRFGKRLYVALPTHAARIQLVQRLMSKLNSNSQCDLSAEDYDEIGRRSEGYSGSDLNHLCREAAMGPLRSITDISTADLSKIRPVLLQDFIAAFQAVRPSVAPKDLVELEAWNRQYGTINSE